MRENGESALCVCAVVSVGLSSGQWVSATPGVWLVRDDWTSHSLFIDGYCGTGKRMLFDSSVICDL